MRHQTVGNVINERAETEVKTDVSRALAPGIIRVTETHVLIDREVFLAYYRSKHKGEDRLKACSAISFDSQIDDEDYDEAWSLG